MQGVGCLFEKLFFHKKNAVTKNFGAKLHGCIDFQANGLLVMTVQWFCIRWCN